MTSPSPQSSLSSFRDYYHHNSEQQSSLFTHRTDAQQKQLLIDGYNNFQITKLFTKLENRISSQHQWLIFFAFKKISIRIKSSQRSDNKENAFRNILRSYQTRHSKMLIKKQFIHRFLGHMKGQRLNQLDKMIKFGLLLVHNKYIQLYQTFNHFKQLRNKKMRQSQWNQKQHKYIQKLMKATLAILLRNIINKKIGRSYIEIKDCNSFSAFTNLSKYGIKALKDKKYNSSFDMTRQHFINIQKIIKIEGILNRKKIALFRFIFEKIVIINCQIDKIQDDPQIYSHIFKHMLYLSSKIVKRKIQPEKNEQSQESEFILKKFQKLTKKMQRRQRVIKQQALLQWRRNTNDDNILHRRQILRLQDIKQRYMDYN